MERYKRQEGHEIWWERCSIAINRWKRHKQTGDSCSGCHMYGITVRSSSPRGSPNNLQAHDAHGWLMDDTAGLRLLNAGLLTREESRADMGLRCKCGM